MQIFRLIIILLLVGQPLSLAAESEIHFLDGTPEWHDIIKNKIESSPLFDNADSLRMLLINSGFSNAMVTMDRTNDPAFIDISFGDQFYIGELIIEGDKNDTIVCNRQFVHSEYEILIDSILVGSKSKDEMFEER